MTHDPIGTGETDPALREPFVDDAAVLIERTEFGTTVTVHLGPHQVLSDGQAQEVAAALGLTLASEHDPAQTVAERPRLATLTELLGNVGIGAAVASDAEPEATTEAPGDRRRGLSLSQRRYIIATVRDRLAGAEEPMTTEQFIESLPTMPQKRCTRALLNKWLSNQALEELPDLGGLSNLRKSADRVIATLQKLYPDLVTAELLEPRGRFLPNREELPRHITGVVSVILKRMGVTQKAVYEELDWSQAKLIRLLQGATYPAAPHFQALVALMHREMAQRSADQLESVALRHLTETEVVQMIERYKQERHDPSLRPMQPQRAVDENHD